MCPVSCLCPDEVLLCDDFPASPWGPASDHFSEFPLVRAADWQTLSEPLLWESDVTCMADLDCCAASSHYTLDHLWCGYHRQESFSLAAVDECLDAGSRKNHACVDHEGESRHPCASVLSYFVSSGAQ